MFYPLLLSEFFTFFCCLLYCSFIFSVFIFLLSSSLLFFSCLKASFISLFFPFFHTFYIFCNHLTASAFSLLMSTFKLNVFLYFFSTFFCQNNIIVLLLHLIYISTSLKQSSFTHYFFSFSKVRCFLI